MEKIADQMKHQSSASLACLRGIHRWPVNSHHKGPVMQKMFPFDDVIMEYPASSFKYIRIAHKTVSYPLILSIHNRVPGDTVETDMQI